MGKHPVKNSTKKNAEALSKRVPEKAHQRRLQKLVEHENARQPSRKRAVRCSKRRQLQSHRKGSPQSHGHRKQDATDSAARNLENKLGGFNHRKQRIDLAFVRRLNERDTGRSRKYIGQAKTRTTAPPHRNTTAHPHLAPNPQTDPAPPLNRLVKHPAL